ncbi:MAG: glutamate 5-kinase [Oscillospiraceae bacterium]|jgi:glutamate 5-kinase|nr:glutamate 5-kinase [Oscillospiraceae bacterium]
MSRRIVFKVGTSTLCHSGKGLNLRNIDGLARSLADIKNSGVEVILVSSGAIGAGAGKLNMAERPQKLEHKQAVAAVGQCELMHIYDKFFGEYGATVAQILLTKDDVDRVPVRRSLQSTFEALLDMGVIPIVNENDSVGFDEIESEHHVFGDNDTLSAIVAELVGADTLVILSDIEGLYDADPHKSPDAKLISVVSKIDAKIEALAGGVGSALGTGGMVTKLYAAKTATAAGIDMIITNGADARNIYAAVSSEPNGTLFTRQKPNTEGLQ